MRPELASLFANLNLWLSLLLAYCNYIVNPNPTLWSPRSGRSSGSDSCWKYSLCDPNKVPLLRRDDVYTWLNSLEASYSRNLWRFSLTLHWCVEMVCHTMLKLGLWFGKTPRPTLAVYLRCSILFCSRFQRVSLNTVDQVISTRYWFSASDDPHNPGLSREERLAYVAWKLEKHEKEIKLQCLDNPYETAILITHFQGQNSDNCNVREALHRQSDWWTALIVESTKPRSSTRCILICDQTPLATFWWSPYNTI